MRQRLAMMAMFIFSTVFCFAQDVEKSNAKKSVLEKPSRDLVMLQFTYEGWSRPDSIRTTGFGRGFNAYLCYDFPFSNSNFSFAAGIGVGTASIYLDNQQIILSDTGAAAQARFVNEQMDYKKYKLTTAYLEAPFELRFFANKKDRNKGFKMAVGLKAGTLVGAHTKGRRAVEGSKFIDKENTRRFMENWRFVSTARIGWGNFSIVGTYNLNSMYKPGVGPQITPYSIGLCISGL